MVNSFFIWLQLFSLWYLSSNAHDICPIRACTAKDLASDQEFMPETLEAIPFEHKCRFHGFPSDSPITKKCFSNNWLFMFGGSQTDMEARIIVASLVSDGADLAAFPMPYDLSYHFDFIKFADGTYSYFQVSMYAPMDKFTSEFQPGKSRYFKMGPGDIRVTRVYGLFFPILTRALEQFTKIVAELKTVQMFLYLGPMGVWYDMCTSDLKAVDVCEPYMDYTTTELLSVFGEEAEGFLVAVKWAEKKGVLSRSLMSRLVPRLHHFHEAFMSGYTSLDLDEEMHIYTSSHFCDTAQIEEVNTHPSFVIAMLTYSMAMTAMCSEIIEKEHFCPVRTIFAEQCTSKNVTEGLKNELKKAANNYERLDIGLHYPGCRLSWREYDGSLGYEKMRVLNEVDVILANKAAELNATQSTEESSLLHHASHSDEYQSHSYFGLAALLVVSAIILSRAASNRWRALQSADSASAGEMIISMYFCRYLASIHVVAGHLQNEGHGLIPNSAYFLVWGYTWVPFFFILSGFVLSLAKLKYKEVNMEPTLEYVWKRLLNIYPVYLTALLLSLLLAIANGTTTASTSATVVVQMFLVHAWIPEVINAAFLTQCWFLSCELAYWFAFPSFFVYLKSCSTRWIMTLAVACCTIPPLAYIFICKHVLELPELWYSNRASATGTSFVDIIVIILKFNPFCYFHLFALGILLAFLIKDESVGLKSMTFVKNGVTIGYIGLFCVFFFKSIRPYAAKLTCRLGLLSPFHSLILLGLSAGEDILCKIFATWYLRMIGEWSYCQFVFQFIAVKLFGYLTQGLDIGTYSIAFVALLLAMSSLAYEFIQTPFKSSAPFTKFIGVVIPSLLALSMLRGVLIFTTPTSGTNPHSLLRQSLSHAETTKGWYSREHGSFDARLNITASGVAHKDDKIINPSIQVYHGAIFIAARKHRLEKLEYNIEDIHFQEFNYHSAIVFGELGDDLSPLAPLSQLPFLLKLDDRTTSFTHWFPCQLEPTCYLGKNNTCIKSVVSGPEDPRLFLMEDKLYLNFFSLKPTKLPGTTCKKNDLQGVPYLSKLHIQENNFIPYDTSMLPMSRSFQYPKVKKEKNWLTFSNEGNLYYVYSIKPHVIIAAATHGNVYQETSPHLAQFEGELHGGAPPILVSIFGDKFYLGSFHSINETSKTEYTHFMYLFESFEPFSVIAVSSPLNLVSQPGKKDATFVSSLAYIGNSYILCYGSGDEEPRVLSMTERYLQNLFPKLNG